MTVGFLVEQHNMLHAPYTGQHDGGGKQMQTNYCVSEAAAAAKHIYTAINCT
jgi:hypothetical protein